MTLLPGYQQSKICWLAGFFVAYQTITEIFFIIKMSAVIKSKIQLLQNLQRILCSKVQINSNNIPIVKLSFINLISLLLSIFTEYLKQPADEQLDYFILTYIQKQCKSAFQFYRHAQGLITMWKQYAQCYQEARAFLSLLQPQRNSKSAIRLFMKIRKAILRNIGAKFMEQINLTQQDIILLTHAVFSDQKKTFISKQIHQMYFTTKKKFLYINKKINGAYFCCFLLDCSQKFDKRALEKSNTSFEHSRSQSLVSIQRKLSKPLSYYQQNVYCQSSEHRISLADEETPIARQTSKFKLSLQTTSPKLLSFTKEEQFSLKRFYVQSTDKQIEKHKYSQKWQKFLEVNQKIKEKLLKPHKNQQP